MRFIKIETPRELLRTKHREIKKGIPVTKFFNPNETGIEGERKCFRFAFFKQWNPSTHPHTDSHPLHHHEVPFYRSDFGLDFLVFWRLGDQFFCFFSPWTQPCLSVRILMITQSTPLGIHLIPTSQLQIVISQCRRLRRRGRLGKSYRLRSVAWLVVRTLVHGASMCRCVQCG